MNDNPLKKLGTLGQSVWMDYVRKDMFARGELRRLIDDDGLHGITSNPSIFEKATAESNLYDKDIYDFVLKKTDVKEIYETLSIKDVRNAADEFRSVYEKTDGYVSLAVNPHLAYQGARPQRLLWASTGTKNHDYSDIKYIEAVIGKNTINTIPPETLNAYRKHGKPALRLESHIKRAC